MRATWPMFFNPFLHITKGPSYAVTRTTLGDNGFETLQLLREQFRRTRRQTLISILVRIEVQKFGEDRCIEERTKRELDISE